MFNGEGMATRKIDGVNIKLEDAKPYIRIKPSNKDYIEAEYKPFEARDNKYIHFSIMHGAWGEKYFRCIGDGIYEAYGENIRGNPERVEGYHMARVSPVDMALSIQGVPRTYRGIMGYLATHDIEGIVWHHRDGRMAKIKTKDFYHLTRPTDFPALSYVESPVFHVVPGNNPDI